MRIARTIEDLADMQAGALVPTMGALHAGHLDLVRIARGIAGTGAGRRPVIVSVFVNPTQFDDRADFARYPRDLARDAALAAQAGADAVFAPAVDVVYPPGADVPIGPIPDCAAGRGLEDEHRPGHFEGVCQVVRRLFVLTRCVSAVFGEKDWQQLQAVRAMSANERLGVSIIPGPTVREPDGLALSSRNVHLTPEERERARSLSRALRLAGAAETVADAERVLIETMREAGVGVNYATVRDAETLERLPASATPGDLDRPARALVAGRLGVVRLLDNMPWPISAG